MAGTTTQKQLYQEQPGTSNGILYTAPSLGTLPTGAATAIIKEITICNTTGTAATVTLYAVPSGGTAGVANMIVNTLSVNGNDTKYITGITTMLPAGGTLQGLQVTSGALTVTVSGVEVQ